MMKLLPFIFYLLFNSNNAFKCPLPEGCQIKKAYETRNYYDYATSMKDSSIVCEIDTDEFQLKFNDPWTKYTPEYCFVSKDETIFTNHYMIFRWIWTPLMNQLAILDRRFNLTNFHRYPPLFLRSLNLKLVNAKGFDVNMIDDELFKNPINPVVIDLINCQLDFYNNKRKLQSCQDFIDSNVTEIRSIFHLMSLSTSGIDTTLRYRNFDYKPKTICPLLFINVSFNNLELYYLENTFYKQSILTISNDTYNRVLNSFIGSVSLQKIQNINLDLSLLHPKVFENLSVINIGEGSLNSINVEIFMHFKNLISFEIYPIIMRKINHKQGIQWIRQINYGINVNLTNLTINDRPMKIILFETLEKPSFQVSKVFPDKDFCIYVHFPFEQFVIVREYYDVEIMFPIDRENKIKISRYYSCTFLWLAQYYVYYYRYFNSKYADDGYSRISEIGSLINLLKSNDYKAISKCDFDRRISLCNKSNYQIKDVWDRNDFLILSKKLQIAVKILLYLISLLGLFTNFIVAIVILKKKNSDLFKGFNQYSYLHLNSIFCMIILVIEILSWMTECFYPFEVFCPEIRKLASIQFFKIIFKECLVTMLRFMCNFTYVAFALNRISLIGREHGKLVTFMSDLGVKKYIGVTLLISASLSWIKGFRYEVNYYFPHLNYPISNEIYIFDAENSTVFNNFYFIFYLISDLLNYLAFVILSTIIDICMVVQLRRTLEERLKKSESLNPKQKEAKKAETEEAVNKAIKMVVLNSLIGICFKTPNVFIPLLNLCAIIFYNKGLFNRFINPGFYDFYFLLLDSGSYSLIQDVFYLLYTFSMSIQMFIYNRFDKKFQTGFERLKEKTFAYIKSKFKSNSTS